MDKKKRYVLLVGILIIATFLRFYHFTTTPPGLYPDEAMDGNNAVEVHETGQFKVYYPEDNGREGLYVNTLAVLYDVGFPTNAAWVVRLPAAVAGVLTVLALYLLIAELFGAEIGLLAAFLLATCFWHINFSRIGFRAILAPLCLTWSLWLFLKAIKAASTARAWIYAVLAGIIFGAGFYTYIAFRITPLIFLLFIPFFRKSGAFWSRTIIFVAVVFVTALPIGIYYLHNPSDFFGRTSEISVTNGPNPVGTFAINTVKELLMFNFVGDSNWRHNISGAPELFFPVGLLFLVGIWLVGYLLWKRWQAKGASIQKAINKGDLSLFGLLVLVVWFLVAIFPAAASNDGIPHALRSILMLPPAIVFAAIGGMWLYEFLMKRWNPKWVKGLSWALLAVIAVFAYYDYFVVWAGNPNVPGSFNENYVTIGQEINALPSSTPKFVVVEAGGVLARGVPVPAETTMYITGSFTTQDQIAKRITYLLPNETNELPSYAPVFYIQ